MVLWNQCINHRSSLTNYYVWESFLSCTFTIKWHKNLGIQSSNILCLKFALFIHNSVSWFFLLMILDGMMTLPPPVIYELHLRKCHLWSFLLMGQRRYQLSCICFVEDMLCFFFQFRYPRNDWTYLSWCHYTVMFPHHTSLGKVMLHNFTNKLIFSSLETLGSF